MKHKEVKLSKELETFLRKKGLLRKFKKNVAKEERISTCYNIAGSFIWSMTPEDWEFWNKIDKEFEEKLLFINK
jgi:hypothetical protein